MTETDDTGRLKPYFEAARREAPLPPGDLMARVLADAQAVQDGFDAPVAAPGRGWPATLFRGLGGWPAMAGLAAASAVGVWIGVSPPDGLVQVAQGVMQDVMQDDAAAYVVDYVPEAAFGFEEGAS